MKAVKLDKSELKDSGIEWIGNIPLCWQIQKCKYVMNFINGYAFKGDDFTNTGIYDVIRIGDISEGTINYDSCTKINNNKGIEDYVIKENDLLIAMSGATVGKIGYVTENRLSYINQRVGIMRSSNSNIPRFLYYCLNTPKFIEYIGLQSPGSAQPNISMYGIGNFKIPKIEYKQQKIIADYLDDRCAKIDAIIAEAKASIDEYKELKQAVITQAVTLGIKKNRPLKDTNILWIGKTPCDWQVAELKFFASIKSGITLGQKYPAGAKLVEMPYLRVANVQGEYVDLSDVKTIQVLPEEIDKYRLEAGVVLMTEGGDRDKLGRGCVWHGEIDPCLHQNHIFALTTKSNKLLPEYFSHVTTSEVARCYFDYTAKKTTNLANTNSSTIMNFRLPIPPIEEQREIVQYLDKRIKTLNDMISEKQSLIEDLEAYKKSLIYEVVTGKRKVVA